MSPHSKRLASIVAALLALAPLCAWAADAAPVSNGARSRVVAPGTRALPIASRSGNAGIAVANADLGIGITVDNATPIEGATVTYTVTLTNNGPDDATGVEVTDLLPSGLTYLASTPSSGSYVSASGVWTVGGVVNGESPTLSLSATVDAGAGGVTIVNSANITAADDVDADPLNNSASISLTVQSADLALTMSVDNASPRVGNTITYTLTLTNNGPDAAGGITVTDLLPAGLTFASATASQGSYVSGSGVWTIGTLASGASATLSLGATVNAGTGGSTIVNSAAVTASDRNDLVSANNTATKSVTVQSADLGVAMTVDNNAPSEHQVVTFTITITNLGPNTATGIAVTDILPTKLSYDSSSPSQGTFSSGTMVWSVGSLASGASATLLLDLKVGGGTNGTILVNTVNITASSQPDLVSANNTASQSLLIQSAEVGLGMTVDNAVSNEGRTVTFTLTLTNNGPNGASEAEVTDLLPAGLTYISSTSSKGSYSSGNGLWKVGSLSNGASATLTLRATVAAGFGGTTITNRGSITRLKQLDPIATNDSTSQSVTVQLVDLGVAMAVDNANPNQGATIGYALKLTNNGPDDATNVVITDALPAGLSYAGSTPSQGSYTSATGAWAVGGLASGASATLALSATVNTGTGGTTLVNTATSAADQADHVPANSSASTSILVQSADLGLAMVVDNAGPNEGATISYTITLTNNGPDTAGGITVTDLLPTGLTFAGATPSHGSYASGTGVWTVGSLAPAASATLVLGATVNSGTGGTTLTNSASITASDHRDLISGNNSASRPVTVQSADLRLAMVVDNAAPNVGNTITYTLTLTNNGPNAAGGIAVTDLLPAGLTYTSSTPSQGAYVSGTGAWTVGSVVTGASATLALRATVNTGTGGTSIVNNASITASDHRDLVTTNNSASRTVTIPLADLRLAMTVDNAVPNEGNTIAYTITLTNGGPSAASGIVVTDLLPAGLTYVSATASQGAYANGTGAWTVASLANGSTVTLTLRGSVNSGAGGSTIVNTATISAVTQADPVTTNNSANRSVTVQLADLALSMTADNLTPNEGGTIVYTLTLINNGPNAASGARVTDLLPAGLNYLSATPSQGSYSSSSGAWTIGNVASGATVTLALRATAASGTGGTTILNTASITAANQADHAPANNTAIQSVTVQLADLALTMAVDNANPNQGATIAYALALTNNGPDAATGVTVTDLLPAGLTFVGATPSHGSYSSGTGVWTIGSLANGATATLTLSATVNTGTGGTTLVNTGTGAAMQADHVSTNNSASRSVLVQSADLALAMVVDNAAPNEGATISYTLTLTNNGPNTAGGIAVTDLLPAGLTFASATPSHGSYTSGTGVWTVGSLAQSASATLVLGATVNSGTGGTTLANLGTITASDHRDLVSGNNSANRSVLVQSADLALAMTVNNATPTVGSTIVFTMTLVNDGPDAAGGITVTNLLPAGLTFVSSTPSQGSHVNGTGVWTVGSLANGASATLALSATVDAGTLGTTMVHTATVMASDHRDPDTSNNTASRSVTVPLSDLGMGMTVNNAAPNEGTTVTYVLTLTNYGPTTANGIMVGDTLPAGLTFVSASASRGTYSSVTGIWTVGSLTRNSSATLSLSAAVDAGTGGTTLVNSTNISAANQADPVPANNTATRSVTVPLADLALAMTADNLAPNEGSTILYTLTLTNNGPDAASGARVTDLLPAGLTYVSATPGQGSYTSGTGVWNIGNVAPGVSVSLALRATANAGTGGTTLSNAASVTASDQGDHTTVNDSASQPVTVQLADLALTMAVDDAGPNQGATISYTLTLTNNGPDDATSVAVTDALPAGLSYVSSTPSQGSYSSGTGVWSAGSLANGGSATLTLSASVDAGTGGTTLTHSAAISAAAQADHALANNTANRPVLVESADLGLAMTVDTATPNEGETVTYTLTLANSGPDAAGGITVVDLVPSGLTYLSSTPSQGSYVSGTGVWTVGGLAALGNATLMISASVNSGTGGTTRVHSASITGSDHRDLVAANDSASASVLVESADLGIAITVDNPVTTVGSTVVFTITVTNNGPDAAGDIVAAHALPAGLTYVNSTHSQGAYVSVSGGWAVGTLASGATATLTVSASVDAGTLGTTMLHTAAITGSDHRDLIASNNTASQSVTVPLADLGIAMTVNDATPNEGDTITCTITLTNNGPTAASGVVVSDTLPAGLTYVSAAPSTGTYSDVTGLWTVGNLGVGGGGATLVLSALVGAGSGGTTLANSATISAANQADPAPANNAASQSVSVLLSDLALAMTVDNSNPNEGDTITCTLTLTNSGPDGATGVRVMDALPAGLTYVSATPDAGTYTDATGLWSVGGLAIGATATLALSASVDAATGGTTRLNTAVATAEQADHDTAGNTASQWVAVTLADLALSMSVDDPAPNQGAAISYTFTITNHGPDAATNVALTEVLPAGLTPAGATPSQGSYASGTGMWTVGSLAANATATLTLAAVVDTGTGGTALLRTAAISAADQADHDAANDSASVSVTIESADLGLAMVADNLLPDEGALVVFTLTLMNHGPDAATGITVLDRLPTGLDYHSDVPSQGTYARASGEWAVGGLASGDSAVLTLRAVVTDGFGGATILHNASITASDHRDVIAANNSAGTVLSIPLADLALSWSVSEASPNEGATITSTLTLLNNGPTAASGISVATSLPAGLSYAGAMASQGTYAGGTGGWTVGSLASGATATLTFNTTVDAGTGGTTLVTNARISAATEADPDTANNSASQPVTVTLADLELTVALDNVAPNEDETVTRTLTLTNHGPDAASGVTVLDALPAGLSYASATASQGTFTSASGEWNVGSLGGGASATITVGATVDAGTGGTTLSDSARVTSADQADPIESNNRARWSVTIPRADLGIAIIASDAAPNEGATVSCTLTITNLGPDAATNVAVTDTLLAGLIDVTSTPSQGNYTSDTGVWNAGSLASGASATITLAGTVGSGTGGTTLGYSAFISAADQADHVSANDSASTSLSVPLADLALAMSVDNAYPAERDTIRFTLTLTNDGPDGATGITVGDSLPAGLTYQSSAPSQGSYANGTGAWSVGGLASGASATLTLFATVDAGTGGTTLANHAAIIKADQADHATSDNAASAAVTVRSADLELAMAVDDAAPHEGASVEFTITLTNRGPDGANGIAVDVVLPAGLAGPFASSSQGSYAAGTGVWTVGGLAAGDSATLALRTSVQSGTGGTDLAASARIRATDHPDPNAANDVASRVLSVRPSLILTATGRGIVPILAGSSAQEVWRMKLVNPSAVPETLLAFTLRNTTRGPGSTSQLDGEWTALALSTIHDGAEQASRATSFSGGRASFDGLAIAIRSRDSVEVVVRAGASLLARVGDTLDVRLEGEADFTFVRAVTIRTPWPVDPPGSFVVDGMNASRVTLEPVGPGNLNAGVARQLALEALLPANGYTTDQLQRLGVVNLGSALAGEDIAKVEAWADDGDGFFAAASDRRLGTLIFTGSRWEITGLSETVPLNGLRVFWTVDLAQFAAQGRTVRLGIPPAPDVGVGMASGNSGPLDHTIEEPWGFTISSLDRVTLSAAPLPTGAARPGDRGVALLHMVATNSYASDRTLSDLTVTNTTQGPGTTAQRDAEIRVVTLRDDGNRDGVLAGTDVDPVLGTGFFSNGTLTFSGLQWSLPAGQTRQLFVAADVSAVDAADGDVLSAVVADEFSAVFAEPTAVTGGWPLDSQGRLTIDGFVGLQLASIRTPSVTVGPNDDAVLALDFVVPPDGYQPDVLRSVRVVNLGNAGSTDIAAMKLWRDGGDGVFSGGGDDVLVGPLVPQSGGWQSPLISVPVGAGGVRSFISVDVASTPAESVTVQLAIPVDGIDNQSGNDGPIDGAIANPDGLLISGEPLLASISAPPASTLGQDVTVRMTVRNTSTETVNAVAPSALAVSGAGSLTLASGPAPASFALAPGAVDTFVWHYTATRIGDTRFIGNAAGTGAVSSLYRRSAFATSGLGQIFIGTSLLAMIPVQTMPVNVNRGQTGVVPFSLTLSNQGGAGSSDARLSHIRIRLTDPAGQGIVPSSLLSRIEVNEGTNVYKVKTTIETSGAEVDLVLDSPVLVNPAQPSTLTLRLDLSPETSVPAFLVSIPDSSWLEADDATSGAAVMVAVVPGGYPLRSGVARVVAETDRVTAELIAADSSRVARGNLAVPLLQVRLDNPGITGISSDVRIYSLALSLTDSAAVTLADPATRLKQLRVRTGLQVVSTQLIATGSGSVLTIPFSPPLTIPANSPLDVTIEADISDSAAYGRFRAHLADTSTLDARDATTRNRVPARYATNPIAGGWVTVEAAADSLVAGGAPLFESWVLIGAAQVPALIATFRNPGAAGTSRVRFDSLRVDCRDDARRPFAPGAYFSRLTLSWNGTVVATTASPQGAGSVTFTLPGLLIEPADSARVMVAVDINPAAPLGSIELMLAGGGIAAADANSGQPVSVGAEAGHDLPILSGLARLQSPARSLSVGMTSRMATAFAADGSSMAAVALALTNLDASGAGAIRIDRLTLGAGDRSYAPLAIGAGVANLEAWVDGAKWAESGPLSLETMTATMLASTPLSIAPGETTQVEIRMVTRTEAAPEGFRLGVDQAGIGVMQPSSALLAVSVQPATGQSFPMWSNASGLIATTLAASYSNFPNPFAAGREATTFVYYLPSSARVTLRIFSPRGESVTTVFESVARPAGLQQTDAWDGRNGRGQTVYNGVYVAELDVRFDDGTRSRLLRKLAVVR